MIRARDIVVIGGSAGGAIGVLLNGNFGNDGAAGLCQIKHRGGIAIELRNRG
jgi:hypothetical protein